MPIVLSLKPHYADMLFTGVKTIELRRRIATGFKGREVFVYVSSPVQKIWGGFRVHEIRSGAPDELWAHIEAKAGVERVEYDAYYSGSGVAHALHVSHVWQHDAPIALGALREILPEFRPPQSWRYTKGRELTWLEEFKREALSQGRARLSGTLMPERRGQCEWLEHVEASASDVDLPMRVP